MMACHYFPRDPLGARTVTGSSNFFKILIRFSYTYFLIKIMVMILMVVVMMTNDACKAHIASFAPVCATENK